VVYLPDQAWLFSGDAFLAERVRHFRRDEDWGATMQTMRRLCALEVEHLYCAHRPVLHRGGEALRNKLGWLMEIEERVLHLRSQGKGVGRIARELQISGRSPIEWVTLGDASTWNMVHAILRGPRPRSEIAALLPGPAH
jgi:glyoxylase-like metal-dependent hydrolase (beta-lactamase superfamily II)